jgi:hypothetical protein
MPMNRRNFLSLMFGGVAAAAAVRTFPFRVFSFPSEVKPLNAPRLSPEMLELLKQRLACVMRFGADREAEWWMHPKQLAALKELGFGFPRIELRAVEAPYPGLGSYYSPDLYPPSRLFDVPIRECPYFAPEAKPVLMLNLVSHVPDLNPLAPQPLRHGRPQPPRF